MKVVPSPKFQVYANWSAGVAVNVAQLDVGGGKQIGLLKSLVKSPSGVSLKKYSIIYVRVPPFPQASTTLTVTVSVPGEV